MKKHLIRLIAALALLTLTVAPAFAQTATTTTTLSAAVNTSSETTIVVASATGFTASSTYAYIDHELMAVRGVNGTTISVIRGLNGSFASPHVNGSVVFVGTLNAYIGYDPSGACVAANYQFLPMVNPQSGFLWNCNNGQWQGTSLDKEQSLAGFTNVGPSAYTAKVTDQIILVTSAVAPGIAVTLPSASTFPIGKVLVIKDGSSLVTPTNAITVTATANQLDGNAATLLITTAYSFVKLVNTGTSWLKIW